MKYGFSDNKHEIFPPMVIVSIVNVCNLTCQHCYWPKLAKLPEYRGNMISWEHWVKVIDEMSEHEYPILNLGTDGEPLMHKEFISMMQYARKKNIYPINITTNGTLLDGKLAEIIIKENLLDTINISLDAFTPETFTKIRGGRTETYHNIHDNIIQIYKLKEKVNPEIKIQVNIIDQPDATHEIKDFKNYWESKVDQVMVRAYYTTTAITGGTGADLTGDQKFEKVDRWPCTLFWRRITVTDDGGIQYCIDDWHHQSKLGHLDKNTIQEVWQSESYNKLREYHLNGEQHKNKYCADCTEWQGMTWDYDYFVAMEKMLGEKFL
jgi:radical SAM protein with 4Fe4S-binding SPASM domain